MRSLGCNQGVRGFAPKRQERINPGRRVRGRFQKSSDLPPLCSSVRAADLCVACVACLASRCRVKSWGECVNTGCLIFAGRTSATFRSPSMLRATRDVSRLRRSASSIVAASTALDAPVSRQLACPEASSGPTLAIETEDRQCHQSIVDP